jgi:hypothetical protein
MKEEEGVNQSELRAEARTKAPNPRVERTAGQWHEFHVVMG